MIIEYLNETEEILASKIVNDEITLEAASSAYNEIADNAITEYAEEVLTAVEEGVISVEEACLIFEMCGMYDDECIVEADYDLSGLSASERKQVEDKLNSMSASSRKKAEAALAKQYPSDEYKAKMEKRKKILKGVGIAAGVGAAAGAAALGARAYTDKKAQDMDIAKSKDYQPIKDTHAADLKAIDEDRENPAFHLINLVKKGGKEGAKAQKELEKIPQSQREEIYAKYAKRNAEADAKFSKAMSDKLSEKASKEGYKEALRKKYKDYKKATKELKDAEKENARKENMDKAWALSRGIKNLGNGFGITKKSIEKRSAKRLNDANKLSKAEYDAKVDEIYKN